MNKREPWVSLVSAAGLIVMLIGDGAADIIGLLIAAAPLVYGFGAVLVRRDESRTR